MAINFDGDRFGSVAGYRIADEEGKELRRSMTEVQAGEAAYQAGQLGKSRSVLASAVDELSSRKPENTAAGKAYAYPAAVANIKSLVTNGMWEEANAAYKAIDADASAYRLKFLSYAGTRPETKQELNIQAGAESYAKRGFDEEELKVNGQTVSIGYLFRDGEGYKNFLGNAIVGKNFSKEFADAYNSDDQVKRHVARVIADPVLKMNGEHEARLQINGVGDLFVKDYDGLKDELGEAGMVRLFDDAVSKRASKGTAIDLIGAVRKSVSASRQADPNADPSDLVQKFLRQYDRRVQSMTVPGGKPDPSDAAHRMVMFEMGAVNDATGGKADFDNVNVRSAMDDIDRTIVRLDRMGINVLGLSKEGTEDIKGSIGEYVMAAQENRTPSEGNTITNLMNAVDLTSNLLSGGCVPTNDRRNAGTDPREARNDPNVALGYSSGSDAIDSSLGRMWTTLLRDYAIPRTSRGARADFALRDIVSDQSSRSKLVSDWGRDISLGTGLTKGVAELVAESAISSAFSKDGQIRPLNLKEIASSLAFDPRLEHTPEQKELLRFFKSENLADAYFAQAEAGYARMLTDEIIGEGVKDKLQLQLMLAEARKRGMILMDNGLSIRPMYEKLERIGRHVRFTGKFVNAKGELRDDANKPGFRPQIEYSEGRGDLDKATSSGFEFGGIKYPAIAKDSYTKEGKGVFYSKQKALYALMNDNKKFFDSINKKDAE